MSMRTGQLDGWLAKGVVDHASDRYAYTMTEDRLALIIVGVMFSVLGLFAVLCRVLALLHRQRTPGYDDYMLFVAYAFSIGFTISSYVSVRWGVGLKLSDAPPSWAVNAIKAEYAIEIFYYFSLFFIKLSILFLYMRLAYELRNHLYWGTLTVLGLLCLQFVSTIIVVASQCIPMEKYWNPTVAGHCVSLTGFFYATNVFTIVTDLIMLVLPLPTILKVPYPRAQKCGLLAAFLLGGLSTLASCVRLYSIKIYTESSEPMKDAAPINTWSFIEVNVAICCASIAVMKQVIVAMRNGSISPTLASPKRSQFSSPSSSSPPSSPLSPKKRKNMSIQENEFARWSRKPDLLYEMETGTVRPNDEQQNGRPIRVSSPLPPPPAAHHPSKEETEIAKRPVSSVYSHHSRGTVGSLGGPLPGRIPTIRILRAQHPWEEEGEEEEAGIARIDQTPRVVTRCSAGASGVF